MWSLSDLRRIGEEGVEFRSHVDGSLRTLTPESCVAVQHALGVDVLHPLDECLAHPATVEPRPSARSRSPLRWLRRAVAAHRAAGAPGALFGIVQGGTSPALRRRAVEETCALDLPGYAIGGLAVGEPKPSLYDITELVAGLLPADRPRYLMGVGKPRGPGRGGGPRRRSLRLRDADAQRAQRPGLHPGRAAQHQNARFRRDPRRSTPRAPARRAAASRGPTCATCSPRASSSATGSCRYTT